MSKTVAFFLHEDIKFEKLIELSNKLVSYCLNKKLGIIFNHLDWKTQFIKELDSNFYFIITDNFFEYNCDFLTAKNILDINQNNGKDNFYKSFSIFDEIYDILMDYSIKNISLLISNESNENSINEFNQIKKENKLYVEILYDLLIKENTKYGYDFPNVLIFN